MGKKSCLSHLHAAKLPIDAGLSGVYAYPGTPSTEITEYIQGSPVAKERNIHCKWSANEKTAMEAALGMSYAGKRSLCCMKHVGLNVAADCFMNAAMSGINGGMIIVTADDPSMHSSQNEQDNRMFGNFAMIRHGRRPFDALVAKRARQPYVWQFCHDSDAGTFEPARSIRYGV